MWEGLPTIKKIKRADHHTFKGQETSRVKKMQDGMQACCETFALFKMICNASPPLEFHNRALICSFCNKKNVSLLLLNSSLFILPKFYALCRITFAEF